MMSEPGSAGCGGHKRPPGYPSVADKNPHLFFMASTPTVDGTSQFINSAVL
jgi:hypothetical protein